MSKDPILEAEMRAKKDFHDTTAKVVFGRAYRRSEGDERKEFRVIAKMANFKILYGGTQFESEKMREFVSAFFDKFPGVKRWMNKCRKYPRRGEMLLSLGRKRRFPMTDDRMELNRQERQAINAGPQNAASEWNNKVFIKMWRTFTKRKMKSYPALMVHDAIIGFSPKHETEEYVEIYKNEAEKPIPFLGGLVIPTEIGVGKNWYEAERAAK